MSSAETVHVALLRGINVGGKNKLPMKELVAMFAQAGCRDVASYIQSGNVVCRAPAGVAKRLAAEVGERIAARYGYDVPIVLRSAAELARVVRDNPFLQPGGSADALHVVFLATRPDAGAVAGLDAGRSPPDAFVVHGREIYLRCPHGVGRSKLTNAYFDAKLSTTSTMRNWRTVLQLLEMTRR